MKFRILFASILFGAALSVSAQDSPIKFGNIPMDDMKMTKYDKDTSAAAVVLVDFGKAYLQERLDNVLIVIERHVRIKILKKEGLVPGGPYDMISPTIPVYKSSSAEEKLVTIKASTYNLEGNKLVETKLPKDAFIKEKFNKRFNFISLLYRMLKSVQ